MSDSDDDDVDLGRLVDDDVDLDMDLSRLASNDDPNAFNALVPSEIAINKPSCHNGSTRKRKVDLLQRRCRETTSTLCGFACRLGTVFVRHVARAPTATFGASLRGIVFTVRRQNHLWDLDTRGVTNV